MPPPRPVKMTDLKPASRAWSPLTPSGGITVANIDLAIEDPNGKTVTLKNTDIGDAIGIVGYLGWGDVNPPPAFDMLSNAIAETEYDFQYGGFTFKQTKPASVEDDELPYTWAVSVYNEEATPPGSFKECITESDARAAYNDLKNEGRFCALWERDTTDGSLFYLRERNGYRGAAELPPYLVSAVTHDHKTGTVIGYDSASLALQAYNEWSDENNEVGLFDFATDVGGIPTWMLNKGKGQS